MQQYTPCHYSNILFEVYRNPLDITQSLRDIFNQTYFIIKYEKKKKIIWCVFKKVGF